eukprot:Awhi_evm1s6867
MKSSKIEFSWLAFNFSQVIFNIVLVKLNQMYAIPGSLLYWNQIFTFCMQVLNLFVFAFHMRQVSNLLRKSPLSGKSRHQVLDTLSKFESFIGVYIFHCIAQGFMCLATIADNGLFYNQHYANVTRISVLMLGSTRYKSIMEETWIHHTSTTPGLNNNNEEVYGIDNIPVVTGTNHNSQNANSNNNNNNSNHHHQSYKEESKTKSMMDGKDIIKPILAVDNINIDIEDDMSAEEFKVEIDYGILH